jgi:hypothetical protein
MSNEVLRGSCLCKSVRYEVSTLFMRFAHCYCSRCRKATGGVRSTNTLFLSPNFAGPKVKNWSGATICPRRKALRGRFAAPAIVRCRIRRGTASESLYPLARSTMFRLGNHPLMVTGDSRVSWVEADESDLPCSD